MLIPQALRIDQRQAMAWSSPADANPRRPTAVLLHGFPMDHHLWDDVADGLQRSARVVAVDLPGFGQSQAIGPVMGMDATADWLMRALDGWGIDGPIALVGLSMGGYVAMEFAARHPQRLSHLVLCNTKCEVDAEAARENRLQMAESVVRSGTEPLAATMPPKLLAPTTLQHHPEVARRLADMIRRTDPAAVAAAQRGMAARRPHDQTLRQITVPLLCVSGRQDALTGPDVMAPMAALAPQGRLEVLSDAGHVTPMETPAAWIDAVSAFFIHPRHTTSPD